MEYTFFHWGLHPWAIYAVIGLSIAYFAYRKQYGNLISATFRPLIGDAAGRAPAKAIGVVAIFATLFGSATSLGLGALQITGGLDNVFDGSSESVALAVAVMWVLTACFVVLAVTGIEEGGAVPLQRQRRSSRRPGVVPLRGSSACSSPGSPRAGRSAHDLRAGLTALQNLVIIVGGAFLLVIVAMCVSLLKALRAEPYESTLPSRVRRAVQYVQRQNQQEQHAIALTALGAEPDDIVTDTRERGDAQEDQES